jgi:uncharacterized membrane protein YraQ (UPF0718 family)
VAVLAVTTAVRGRALMRQGLREGGLDFLRLMPRIIFGVMGAGFIAALLPEELVAQWLGPASGAVGVALAALAGALTPGGPVLGFAMAAAALKAGGGAPQVIAYLTAWALFAFPRLLLIELATMPPRVVWMRVLVSLPVPFLAAAGAMLIGRP